MTQTSQSEGTYSGQFLLPTLYLKFSTVPTWTRSLEPVNFWQDSASAIHGYAMGTQCQQCNTIPVEIIVSDYFG